MAWLRACLKDSNLQEYLEECEPERRRAMESRLASCGRCRAAFDRVMATNRRVNAWLSRLSIHGGAGSPDASGALNSVLTRIEARPEDHGAATRLFAGRDYRGGGTNPKAIVASVLLQGALVGLLLLAGTSETVRAKVTRMTLIEPPPIPKVARVVSSRSGGGGQHSPLPPQKAPLPKPMPRVFTPPLVAVEHPALVMNASLLTAPDAWAAPSTAIGNPLGVFGGAGGPGDKGGIGSGSSVGVGSGDFPGTGDGGDVGIFNVGGGVTKPQVISQADPEYSEEARKAKYSGSVMLSIVVNTDGKPADIRVVKSLGMGLDEKAVEAVQRWRFRPGTNHGAPVRVRAQIEVNFRLL